VFSHGWYDLPPFEWAPADRTLHAAAVLTIGGKPFPTALALTETDEVLTATAQAAGRWTPPRMARLEAVVRRMAGLHLELTDFHSATAGRFAWAADLGLGRMLCGASVFEDAVKLLCTTNCSWSLTRLMCQRMTDALGEPTPGGRKAFPTPAALAAVPLEFYRDEVRAGYRSAFLKAFADDVAEGRVDPEAWPSRAGDAAELMKEMRRVKGFGPYVAENLCKLFGRFDGLGVDSWCRNKFVQIHGEPTGDVEAALRAYYEPFGKWKGLALWLDLTKDWHETEPHSEGKAAAVEPPVFKKR
ncbi:MAG: DNA-3-methyladenine glycosylase family protein, partial [Planctomycetia bacterium]